MIVTGSRWLIAVLGMTAFCNSTVPVKETV